MNLVIIDYGSGNLKSVENAFKNSVKINKLKCTIKVTNNLSLISKADHIILPGVGSFNFAMKKIKKNQRESAGKRLEPPTRKMCCNIKWGSLK